MYGEDRAQAFIGGITGVVISSSGLLLENIESIVSIICSIGGFLITLAFVVIIPIIKKVINAKKNDGKIDADEAADIIDTLKDGITQIKDSGAIDQLKDSLKNNKSEIDKNKKK